MTKHRVARKPTKKEPAWEAQAREKAEEIGVSLAKVKQRVEKELTRIVAEEIAKKEIARLRTPQVEADAPGKGTESALQREVRKKGSAFPGEY